MQLTDPLSVQTADSSERLRALAHTHFIESADIKRRTADACLDSIVEAAKVITNCFRRANKLLLCGNGGSAADAQHMAAEFVNRLSKDFERPGLPAIALTTDTSFLTSYANDYGFDGVFERQVKALGQRHDVLIGISTSAKSKNVIKAIVAARQMGLETIGLIGEGGEMASLVDCPVVVPSTNTQHIQEALLSIEHVLCLLVERELFDR
jgi:D-sedoheptulose 7-phosphate isomerase